MNPSIRILLADDEEDILVLLQRMLEADPSYQFLLARDGFKALAVARNELPDLIILDVIMPGLTGFQICRTLKQESRTSHIKIILLTALNQENDRTIAMTAGVDGFLNKPLDLILLVEEVRRVLHDKPAQ